MRLTKSIPALPVQDIARAVVFYRDKLGFSLVVQEEGFARLVRDDVLIDLWAACDESWKNRPSAVSTAPIVTGAESFLAGTASCRIEVQAIDELYAENKESGVLYAPDTTVKAQPWGDREFPALDLERNLLTFFERK